MGRPVAATGRGVLWDFNRQAPRSPAPASACGTHQVPYACPTPAPSCFLGSNRPKFSFPALNWRKDVIYVPRAQHAVGAFSALFGAY